MRKLLRRNLSAWLRCVLSLAIGASIAAPAQAEELVIPGSGNPEYVLGALAKAFNAAQNRHRVSVPPSIGTAGALREVEQGSATLGRVGRPLKEAELAKGLKYIALGRDPVVFVAGAAVTVRNLTRSEAIDIYTGKLTDWRGLNGKPGPIRAIGREGTDTSRQAIARAINAFVDISYAEQVKMVHLDPQMIELLDRYPTSLGFLNRSALAFLRWASIRLMLRRLCQERN